WKRCVPGGAFHYFRESQRDILNSSEDVRTSLLRLQNSDRGVDFAFKLPRVPILRIELERLVALAARGLKLVLQIQRQRPIIIFIRQLPIVLPRAIYWPRIPLLPILGAGVCSWRRRYDGGRTRRRRRNLCNGLRRSLLGRD